MKLLKKISLVLMVFLFTISISGCNKTSSLEKKMNKLYEGIEKEDLPKLLSNIEITDKNVKYYLGVEDIEYKSALASEGAISTTAHSVVLVKIKNKKDVDSIKNEIKENINPKKWIVVGVEEEDVVVESNGKLIMVLLIKDETIRNKIKDNFSKL